MASHPQAAFPVNQYLWLDCSATGTILFSPGLTNTASSTTTVKVRTHMALEQCNNTRAGAVVVPSTGESTPVIDGILTCVLANGSADPTTGKANWVGEPKFQATKFTFSGFQINASSTGTSSLLFPNPGSTPGSIGGTASATGSFTGGEGGASSTMNLSSPTNITSACDSKRGLRSMTISGGTVVFG